MVADQDRAVPAIASRPGKAPRCPRPTGRAAPGGPAPGLLAATSCVEVQRLVNSAGIITLGNQVIQVGSRWPGSEPGSASTPPSCMSSPRTACCGAPCPALSRRPGAQAPGRPSRSPEPLPTPMLTVQRKVSSRGGIQVAGQRIQVGSSHASNTVTIELGDTSLRVIDHNGELLTTTPRNATAEISRYKSYGAGGRHDATSRTGPKNTSRLHGVNVVRPRAARSRHSTWTPLRASTSMRSYPGTGTERFRLHPRDP